MAKVFAPIGSYVAPLSVWETIAENIPASEHEEIRHLIGTDIIDNATDLRNEAENLFEILKDARSIAQAPLAPVRNLPESNELRSRLRKEIVGLVEMMREKAQSCNMSVDDLLKRHNQHVLDYAFDAMTARSSKPTAIQQIGADRGQSQLARSTCAFHHKVDYLVSESVLTELRTLVHQEIAQLHADVRAITECIDRVVDPSSFDGTHWSQPTLAELKLERNKLEKELVTELPIALCISPCSSRPPSAELLSARRSVLCRIGSGSSTASGEVVATLMTSNTSASAMVKQTARLNSAAESKTLAKSRPKPKPKLLPSVASVQTAETDRTNRFRKMVLLCRDNPP